MQCNVCGSNLVRGFTFCLECGNPVPPEMLEESGLPQRNTDSGPQEISVPETAAPSGSTQTDEITGDLQPRLIGDDMERGEELKPQLMGGDTFEQGKALKPKLMGVGDEEAGEALKPKLIGGEEQTGVGAKVKATMQNSSADVSDNAVEKLVFCPNCGMHMQHDLVKCEICGMTLGNMPNNVPKSASGMPLFNTDPDPFSGAGGIGGFGGFGGISDEDVSSINNFVNSGSTDPMFNSGSSAFNVQATPADFAKLTQQLASFSVGADMPNIGVTENTKIRQKAVPKGQDVELSDFSMTDDLQSESIPIMDSNVPVVGDYSMDENPDEDVNIDPFAFVGMSMDEEPQFPAASAQPAAEIPAAVPAESEPIRVPSVEPISAPVAAPVAESVSEPVKPLSFFGEADGDITEETAPFIAEQSPVISEASLPEPMAARQSDPLTELPNAVPRRPVTKPAPPAEQPVQQVQQAQPTPQAQPAQPFDPFQPAPKPVEKTKKCFACGRTMPAKDKFCPNCGRSMFGMPNPNLAPPPPPPQKKSNKGVIVIVVVLLVIAAAIVVGFFIFKGSAAELDINELTQTVFSADRELSATVSQHIVS